MLFGPFDERVCVIRDRSGRRTVYMLEDEIKHGSCVLGELAHKLTELAVEVAKKEKGFVAEDGEARIVDRPDRILRPEQPRHHGGKLLRQCFCIRRRLQGKCECKVALVCHKESPWFIALVLPLSGRPLFE